MTDSGVVAPPLRKSLVHDPDFLKFWIGQSISVFGAQFSPIAIQYIAVRILHVADSQLGYLAFFNTIPFLTIGLFVGVWADRHRRRRILVLADFGRAAVLFAIPLTAMLYGVAGVTVNLLYVVTLLAGILTVFFEITYQSFIPNFVERSEIVEANSKMEASRSSAQAVGPAVAGFVVKNVSAALAVLADSLGYLVSSVSLLLIKRPEAVPAGAKKPVLSEIREGLSIVFGDKRLRAIAATTATSNFFGSAGGAIMFNYLLTDLRLSPDLVGLGFGIGSVGGVLGALTAGRVINRLGVGRTIILGIITSGVNVSLYFASPGNAFLVLSLSTFILTVGVLYYNIPQVSYRQAIVPKELQGKLNATMRTIVWGVLPIGSLIGGVVGDILGTRSTVGLMAALGSFAFLWILFSPVRQVKEFPND